MSSLHTCQNRLRLHLQPDLDQVHRRPQAHRHQPGQHAGRRQVQQAAGVAPVAVAVGADEPLRVAEEAEDHRVVDGDAGQRERHAFKEPRRLWGGKPSAPPTEDKDKGAGLNVPVTVSFL